MCNVMLDLETMGTGSRAAIVAIGAVVFDLRTQTVNDRFYRPVDLASSVDTGGEMDAGTVLWWMQQSDEARSLFLVRDGVHLVKALQDFSLWLEKHDEVQNIHMWGNGAAFDNVILANAYKSVGQKQPWCHWNDRCYRTIKSFHPSVKITRSGVYHNALDDAESQACHLIQMLTEPPHA